MSERLAVLPFLRLGIHVVSVFVIFVLVSFGTFIFLDMGNGSYDFCDFILSLGAIVAFAALVDGIIEMAKRSA